ncbi:MAG: DUF6614 family protein [Pseudomonadota bacterium]
MITMHGLFTLKDEFTLEQFSQSFNDYAQHLSDQGYVTGWTCFFREPHNNYNLNSPEQHGLISMDFPSRKELDECWDFVVADEEPIHSYHKGVNTKVTDISFWVSQVVKSGTNQAGR